MNEYIQPDCLAEHRRDMDSRYEGHWFMESGVIAGT